MTKAGRLPCNANSSVDLFQRRCWLQKRLCLLRVPDLQFTVSCLIESFKFGVFLQRTRVLEIWSFIKICFAQERGSCGITGDTEVRVYVEGTPPASEGMRLPGGARLCKQQPRRTEQHGQDRHSGSNGIFPLAPRPARRRSRRGKRRRAAGTRGRHRTCAEAHQHLPPAKRGKAASQLSW